jgi:LPS-assembly protein
MLINYNPDKSENITNLDRKINSTNLFSNNRLGLTDSLEGGSSITLGFDYDLKNLDNNKMLGFRLGQIFKDTNESRFPKKSTMQNKSSDLIGLIEFYPSDNFVFNYEFSADNNLDTMNSSKIDGEIKINNFVTSFEFLEENNDIGTDSYLTNDVRYDFDKQNSILFNTRRNRKTDLTEYYNLIYEYRNDCLVAAIEYNKDYYQDRDLKPSEEIFFKITITPFASVSSPSFNK